MKSRETNHEKWSIQLSKGHKHNRSGHLTQQSVQERATGTNRTPRCVIQEPEWPVNPSQGGLVHQGIISLRSLQSQLQDVSALSWALNTVGTAGTATLPNPLCRDRVCGFRVPLLSSISSPVLYTEKKLCLCSTEISQINLYFMQKKYNHADNAFISKAEICIIKPLFLKKLDSQNHKPKK